MPYRIRLGTVASEDVTVDERKEEDAEKYEEHGKNHAEGSVDLVRGGVADA